MTSLKIQLQISILLGLSAVSGRAAPAPQPEPSALLFILDASGSMWGQIEGENKIVIARRVLSSLIDGLPDTSQVGVIAYGHRREGDCDDIQTIVPMSALQKDRIKKTVADLNPRGKTPITKSIEQAFDSLKGFGRPVTVVLLSDGLETCGGDPCQAVRKAKSEGLDFLMHIIGFDVGKEDVSQLECSAQAGQGLFLSAENAEELSAALERVVALPADLPSGGLSVKVIADGQLHDAAVSVTNGETGEELGGGRTYAVSDTNPRFIPLPAGNHKVVVQTLGIKGDGRREFDVRIEEGATVEKTLDFSTGELKIGVTRNGELSDAVYRIRVASSGEESGGGRTYGAATSNLATVRLTSGVYEVSIRSVEISGQAELPLGRVTIDSSTPARLTHDFASGTLKVGVEQAGTLLDATLSIINVKTGTSVAAGRTYKSPQTNPKTFTLEPGDYRVDIQVIRGPSRQITVQVVKGETVEQMVTIAAN